MANGQKRIIFHIDVNSAFLSWTAVKRLQENPDSVDLRTVPSAVGGDVETRHGIITAKSIPAKKYHIETGEPVVQALRKCPGLILVPSDFQTYRKYSRAFISVLHEYSPLVEQASIDEAYLDVTDAAARFQDRDTPFPLCAADEIRQRIRDELGFTVNVGISENKLLAKTASDFVKPDRTHTLWPEELPEKFWPLPIEKLFGCGAATAARLRNIGVKTIGEAAHTELAVLQAVLGEKSGQYIHDSANGLGSTAVHAEESEAKGYSNERTTATDITPENYDAEMPPLLSFLADSVASRLQRDGVYASTIGVMVKTDSFRRHSRQRTLKTSTNSADEILRAASSLMQELLQGDAGLFAKGDRIRLAGVSAVKLDRGQYRQMSLADYMSGTKQDPPEEPKPSAGGGSPIAAPSERTFIAIDLKSFYASVECVERHLNPLDTNLVVADASRTDKTICLAVSPSLKSCGIPGRARLFEVNRRVREVNEERKMRAPGKRFTGKSSSASALAGDPSLELGFETAVPRMALYMEYSTRIYEIYLRYIAPEDIHVYSIDEVLMDVTHYLRTYRMSARELAVRMIGDILRETGITAAAGIGTNLYLCKIAMDIEAKHVEPDENGVRIAELDEMSYRRKLWDHRPLTDFWRVGRGYAKKLERHGIYTMGDIALTSVQNEELLYRLFGVSAELLIDHAWGWEPCTMESIRNYRPENNSFSSGQVLQCPYDFQRARVVAAEMADAAAMDLVEKDMVTDQVVLTVAYDQESLTRPEIRQKYNGTVKTDYYGRKVPEHAHGSRNLPGPTSSSRQISDAVLEIYDSTVNPDLLVRYITVVVNHVTRREEAAALKPACEQLELFADDAAEEGAEEQKKADEEKERRLQEAVLSIRKKFGKNMIVKGLSYQDGATGRERNEQIGGHKS